MMVFAPLTVASRALATAVIAAVFMLGATPAATHSDDGCNDEFCTSLQCDMATGNGCGTLCVHAAATLAGAKPDPSPGSILVAAGPDSGPGLRLPDRLYRPPDRS